MDATYTIKDGNGFFAGENNNKAKAIRSARTLSKILGKTLSVFQYGDSVRPIFTTK
jgi:hypothetical protein